MAMLNNQRVPGIDILDMNRSNMFQQSHDPVDRGQWIAFRVFT